MTPTTDIQPLSHKHRRIFFIFLVFIFVSVVPLMVFYAIGYRFDFTGTNDNIKAVGGMYISSRVDGGDIYIDDELVENMRIFRSDAYIQNLEEGIYEVHVQSPNVQTWTKRLPVFPHLVTEAESFNMPVVPQIRTISQWLDIDNRSVVFASTTLTYFTFASNTTSVIFSTSSATSTFIENVEYAYIQSLFASSSELQKLQAQNKNNLKERFNFTSASSSISTSTATTTKNWRDTTLYTLDDDLYSSWVGSTEDIPYYYCVTYQGKDDTSLQYGTHVYEALSAQLISGTDPESVSLRGENMCRDSIRINRLDQEIQWFDFYPDSTDIVLVLLEDGLYVIEVDDRSWQNTQQLYPGNNISVVLDGGRIYIKDTDTYLELFLKLME